ncbi:hypothetical protein BpHYR1_015135 [Brachionus plicatilis]|uniref:C-type lectin domain-containing protein n=1 Tax=Brachionus plicatilis TaxID=10195 RepID=A0A3M7T740_BRAPC|nr:hypothetical protein BpHYR1_015135 [Brachionus plicatilis]
MKVVFRKKFIIDSPCINGANCVNKLNGLNETDSCKPCMTGFTTFNSYPFNCYKQDGNRKYESAKLFCQSLNSFLWRPKTLTELNFLNDLTWAESKITYVGQPFVWPDGSIVYNFDENEPNNSGGDISSLRENAAVSQDSMLVDSNFENEFLTLCQADNPINTVDFEIILAKLEIELNFFPEFLAFTLRVVNTSLRFSL